MNVISLKDYAAQNNISYEAVRQQVVRYKEDLEAHIIRDGRQQFLDEEAVAFLDNKRQKNPVAIIQQSKDDAIEELRGERDQLLLKIAAQADRISELAQWKADNAVAIAAAGQTQLLLDTTRAELDQVKLDNAAKDAEMEQARQEAAAQAEDLRRQLDQERAEREAVEEQLRAMKGRGLFARIFRKGE